MASEEKDTRPEGEYSKEDSFEHRRTPSSVVKGDERGVGKVSLWKLGKKEREKEGGRLRRKTGSNPRSKIGLSGRKKTC